ncbi:MAG: AmmeMemoRadiSam system protein B [Syntrophales bacterium]|nr:AmmeMemoRadiSam system protein B [Syntrophales bacterium]
MKYWMVVAMILFSWGSGCSQPLDRQPAVAGQFYPADPGELKNQLKSLFARAVPPKGEKNVLAVIVPHAGYVFSGEVAASGFNQIDPDKSYENIFLIGSSHQVAFDGAAVYTRGDFKMPLGKVRVNTELGKELVKKHSIFTDRVDAHQYEHSLEVELPFLQYRLKKDLQIVPIVIGTHSPQKCAQIAEALKPYFNEKNLFIVSTDLSHYPSYEDAKVVDQLTLRAITTNEPETLLRTLEENERKKIPRLATSLCGWTSVLTLMYITSGDPSITYTLVDYKNSGDSIYGDRIRVVGYGAVVVSRRENPKRFSLSDKEKKDLLSLARKTIKEYVERRKLPAIEPAILSENLKTPCGAFVTLHRGGALRGCIGRFEPNEPLYQVVQQMAVAAATEDFRFPPVQPSEVDSLDIEISVLTPLKKIKSIDEIELGRHGIYIKKGARAGTFLPQVATETGWSKEEFLGHCARDKAGLGWNGWKEADIYVYEALVFSEKDFRPR